MTISANSFARRLEKLRSELASLKVDALVIERPLDLAYLTGLKLSAGKLLVHSKETLLAVDGRYRDHAQKQAPVPVIDATKKALLGAFDRPSWKKVRTVGFDAHAFSYKDYLTWKALLAATKKARRITTAFKLKPLDHPILNLRLIKDEAELRLIEKSAALLWKGFQKIKASLREGMSEQELAVAFEMYCKKEGASSLSFDPIIAFGSNSAFPHYVTGKRRLKRGDLVLIDIGVIVDGYASDMTRVLFFGPSSPRLKKIFSVVKKAQEAALALCKPGVRGSALDAAARAVMAAEGWEEHYLHTLGHGIGLEVHEPPRLSIHHPDVILKPGMVVSIEPGLYFPNLGGARYEDMVIITSSGHRNLFPQSGV